MSDADDLAGLIGFLDLAPEQKQSVLLIAEALRNKAEKAEAAQKEAEAIAAEDRRQKVAAEEQGRADQRARAEAERALAEGSRRGDRVARLLRVEGSSYPRLSDADHGSGSESGKSGKLSDVLVCKNPEDVTPVWPHDRSANVCAIVSDVAVAVRGEVPPITVARENAVMHPFFKRVVKIVEEAARRREISCNKRHHENRAVLDDGRRPDFIMTPSYEQVQCPLNSLVYEEVKPACRKEQSAGVVMREGVAQAVKRLCDRFQDCQSLPFGKAFVCNGMRAAFIHVDFQSADVPVTIAHFDDWRLSDAALSLFVAWTIETDVTKFGLPEAARAYGNTEYRYERLLGSGGFADVVLVRQAATGAEYAAKFVRQEREHVNLLEIEKNVLDRLTCAKVPRVPRACGYYSVAARGARAAASGAGGSDAPSDGGNGLLLQPVGESLVSHLQRLEEIGERRTFLANAFVLLLDTVRRAHAAGICHGDIRPPNIIVVAEGGVVVPYLIDWGLAADAETMVKPLGAPAFLAPGRVASWESLKSSVCIKFQDDITALALTYVALCVNASGQAPWPHCSAPLDTDMSERKQLVSHVGVDSSYFPETLTCLQKALLL